MKIQSVQVNWSTSDNPIKAPFFHEIPGNEDVKRALEVALVGSHQITLVSTRDQSPNGSTALNLLNATAKIAQDRGLPFSGKVVPVCPCGGWGTPCFECICTIAQLNRHHKKIYPHLKEADILIDVQVGSKALCEQHHQISKRILMAYGILGINRITLGNILPHDKDTEPYLKQAVKDFIIDKDKILSVATTIATMGFRDRIQVNHMAEAIQYCCYHGYAKELCLVVR
jgi:predicted ATPase with chaperone activity